jgi:hypothetical protein
VNEFAMILFFFAGVFLFVGLIRLLIEAFGVSPLWLLGCVVFPPSALLFVWFHWEDVRGAFWLIVAGTVLAAATGAMIPPQPKVIRPALPDKTDKIGAIPAPAAPAPPIPCLLS